MLRNGEEETRFPLYEVGILAHWLVPRPACRSVANHRPPSIKRAPLQLPSFNLQTFFLQSTASSFLSTSHRSNIIHSYGLCALLHHLLYHEF